MLRSNLSGHPERPVSVPVMTSVRSCHVLLLCLVSCVSMSCFSVAYANQKNDEVNHSFEFKAVISVDNDKSIQKLILPESVQNKLHDKNGQDLRVYNAAGEVVPYHVQYETGTTETAISKPMAFYPVYAEAADKISAPGSAQIKTHNVNDAELTIELRLNSLKQKITSPDVAELSVPAVYLIENPQFINGEKNTELASRSLHKLEINWQQNFEGIAALKLETSSDLSHWKPVVNKEHIADLRFMDQQLHRNTVMLDGNINRFIRLTWLTEKRPAIAGLNAVFSQQLIKPLYEWSSAIQFSPSVDKSSKLNSYEFTISPAFKADRIRFLTTASNQVFSGNLLTRYSENTSWYHVTGFQFYRIGTNGSEISMLEKTFAPQGQQNWLVQFQYPESRVLHNELTVQVARYPLTLFFLQQGKGPFYLKYGSRKVSAQSNGFSNILPDLLRQVENDYGNASVGHIEELTPGRLASETTELWKKIILWSVLIVGVLLMLWMAKGLFVQMSDSKGER